MRTAKIVLLSFTLMMIALGCAGARGRGTEAAEKPAGVVSRREDVIEHGPNERSLNQLFGSAKMSSGDSLYLHDGGSGRLDFGDQMLISLFNDTVLNGIYSEIVDGIPRDVQMFLVEGGLTGRLTGSGGRAVIKTPTDALINILGTEFFIIHDPARDLTAAGNFGGTIDISSGGSTVSVESGFFVVTSEGEPPGDQLPIGESLETFEQRATALNSPIAAYDELLCDIEMEFLRDVSIPRGSIVQPGEAFIKRWEVRNSGNCSWNEDYTLQFVDGDVMRGDPAVSLAETVDPGENQTLSVSLVAPRESGVYHSLWQLIETGGEAIGPLLEIEIVVSQTGSTPTYTPTPTDEPSPIITPSRTPTVEPCQELATVTAILDGNIRTGPDTIYDIVGALVQGNTAEVIGRESTQPYWWKIDVPHLSGDQHWIADSVVSFNGDRTCVPVVKVPPPPVPVINLPPEIIQVDARCTECEVLVWESENVDAVYINGDAVPLSGSHEACLSSGDKYELDSGYEVVHEYDFVAEAPGWVQSQTTEVTWTLPEWSFYSSPYVAYVYSSTCTTLNWVAEDALEVTLDGEPVANEGNITVCPEATQTYVLNAVLACGKLQKEVTVDVPDYSSSSTPEYGLENFEVIEEYSHQLQFSVDYSYLYGFRDPIYIGARALEYGSVLDNFSFIPAEIHPGSGTATVTLEYNNVDPPVDALSNQIEVYMYWSAEEYYRRTFYFSKTWYWAVVD